MTRAEVHRLVDEIPDEKVPKDMLELATHIVRTKLGKSELGSPRYFAIIAPSSGCGVRSDIL